jgi:hypothetical protein
MNKFASLFVVLASLSVVACGSGSTGPSPMPSATPTPSTAPLEIVGAITPATGTLVPVNAENIRLNVRYRVSGTHTGMLFVSGYLSVDGQTPILDGALRNGISATSGTANLSLALTSTSFNAGVTRTGYIIVRLEERVGGPGTPLTVIETLPVRHEFNFCTSATNPSCQ